jgi:hypothetical protein
MTLDQKLDISKRAFELLDAGDREGYSRLIRSVPMPPYLAKVYKEKALLKQRLANLPTAQKGYIEKQKKALAN